MVGNYFPVNILSLVLMWLAVVVVVGIVGGEDGMLVDCSVHTVSAL